ncbi:MAG: YeiH family protein [Bacillota bacterium]
MDRTFTTHESPTRPASVRLRLRLHNRQELTYKRPFLFPPQLLQVQGATDRQIDDRDDPQPAGLQFRADREPGDNEFGMWAGVAIHDISSVVGASSTYGQVALQTATAVKLSRSLWIVPLVFAMAFIHGRAHKVATGPHAAPGSGKAKVDLPWFIGVFLLASVARSLVPAVASAAPTISHVATLGLILVLFLIGANLSRHTLKAVGWRAAVQGLALWAFISISSLLVILHIR